jgi:hypothetical protein
MDPDPSYSHTDLINTPKGAAAMEWYETLLVLVVWDTTRSFFTAWLTKRWLVKDKGKRKCQKCSKTAQ